MRLTEVRISGVRGFPGDPASELVFDDGDGNVPRWIVVAGRNGAGKSTLLRAIAMAIVGPAVARVLAASFQDWIRVGEERADVAVRVVFDDDDAFSGSGKRPGFVPWTAIRWTRGDGREPSVERSHVSRNWSPERGPWADNPRGWFVAGYGPFRRLSSAATDAQRLMMSPGRPPALASLFREDASLSESVQWLKQVYLRRLEKRENAEEMEALVLRVLNDGLLPEGMSVQKIDSDGLWVMTPQGHTLALNELSDGYRTVSGLALDLIKQLEAAHGSVLYDAQNDTQIINSGVVLIDEVDVHLHVEWQKRIGFWLKEHFPNLQFIVTTHSPFICQAADEGGLVRLSPSWIDGPAAEIVTGEEFNRVVRGTLDDAVLSGMFGLETVLSTQARAIRDRVAEIEIAAMNRDLTEAEVAELGELRAEIPHTQSEHAAAVLRTLGVTE